MTGDGDFLKAALDLLERGWQPVPIARGSKAPPRGYNWSKHRDRLLTPDEVRAIWDKSSPPHVGVVCGGISGGLSVVDIDDPALARRLLDAMQGKTRLETTPSGGLHIYVISDAPVSKGKLADKVDLQAEGSFVVCQPTPGYKLADDAPPLKTTPEARSWATELLRMYGVAAAERREPAYQQADAAIPDGRRHSVLPSIAGAMRRALIRPEWIESALSGINETWGRPPLDAGEIERMARNIATKTPAKAEYADLGVVELWGPDSPPPQPVEWIVDNFIPGKLITFLFGYKGHGKSYLLLLLALCLATGQPFLDLPTMKRRVLWIDWEMNRDFSMERALALLRGTLGLEAFPSDWTFLYLNPHAPLASIYDDVRQRIIAAGIEVTFIDSMGLALAGQDMDSAKDVIPAMMGLQKLCDAVVVTDHKPKPQKDFRATTPIGSVYKSNLARNLYEFQRQGPRLEDRMHVTIHLEASNFGLHVPDIDVEITGVAPGSRETRVARVQPVGSRLLDELRQRGRATADELGNAVGLSKRAVQKRLKPLVDDGTLELKQKASTAPGVYSIGAEGS